MDHGMRKCSANVYSFESIQSAIGHTVAAVQAKFNSSATKKQQVVALGTAN